MQVTAADVLSAFRRDEPQLFIAAASITVALVAIAFSLIRKRFDAVLSFFAWFAASYGVRLWMQSGIYDIMAPHSVARLKLQLALTFFVAIPGFLFFEATGLTGRSGRFVVHAVCLTELCLIASLFLGVPTTLLDRGNSIVVIFGFVLLLVLALRQPMATVDSAVLRTGLVIFIAFVFWSNIERLLDHRPTMELYGFAVFLCCLGYVAANRALERDHQLTTIQQELEVAKRIQLSILPTSSPVLENFVVAVRYLPMTSVAGDFYEFICNGDRTLGLMIADVSGHGVPAALIASMVKVAIQSQRHYDAQPDRLLAGVNEALCGNTQNQFVTAAYVHLDAVAQELSYSAAGHPPMLLLREGKVSSIEENGLVLAILKSAVYTSTRLSLLKGDRLLLYTDGILEAANDNEEEFGRERLINLLQASTTRTAEEVADLVQDTVRRWSPNQSDDLTVLVCDYKEA